PGGPLGGPDQLADLLGIDGLTAGAPTPFRNFDDDHVQPHQVCGRNPDVFTFQYRTVITEYFDERCRDISLHLVAAWLAEVGRSHERFDGPEPLVGMLGPGNPAGKT